jgi:endo-1,4-beta-xylanase
MNPLTTPPPHITRREHLRHLTASALFSMLPGTLAAAASSPNQSSSLSILKTAAAAAGLLYGSDSDVWFRNAPPAWQDLLLSQCDLYAPILSWQEIAADPTHEDDARDLNAAIALRAGLKLTGAHLLWHRRTPPWLETLSRADAYKAMAAHIQRLVSFYRGQCFSWNVVNEAIEPAQHRPDGLRADSPLLRALGPNFFADAFHQARAADPTPLLLYNEYGLELDTPDHEARRTALFHLLDRLQTAGAPIDGVGLQSHLTLARFTAFNEQIYRRFLHDLAARGLKIVISELDVDDRRAPANIAERDRQVAAIYARFLAVALDEPAVAALVTWGLSDAYSWYNGIYFPEFARPDHLPQRPLLFDASLQPKPSFYAVLHALQQAPKRPASRPSPL